MNIKSIFDLPLYSRGELGYSRPNVQGVQSSTQTAESISTEFVPRPFPVLTSYSTQALPRNTKRRMLYLKNNDNLSTIFLNFNGAAEALATKSIRLLPGEELKFDSDSCPIGSVNAIADVGNPTLLVGEG